MSLFVNDVWIETLKQVLNHGELTSPRRKVTKELAKTTVTNMNYPILTIKNRELGYKFMAAEAYWILSGDNRVETIKPYSKMIENFSDDGVTFFGAYGPKFVDQSSYVVNTLREDPDSRQAVINIWREKPGKTKDVPCTLNLQWTIRNNRLDCHANMRSSDLWLGWPYDTFNFSMLSRYILHQLDVLHYDLGYLYLHSSCMHLYKTDWEDAEKCIEYPVRHIEPVIESTSCRDLMRILRQLKEVGFDWPKTD